MDTNSVQVILTGPLVGFIHAQVTQGDYGSPEDYITSLVDADRVRRLKQQLDGMLVEGLESGPPLKYTTAGWAERCDEMLESLDRQQQSEAG